jgi:hypothetical protein
MLEFQTALGDLVRGTNSSCTSEYLQRLQETPGFHLTRKIQRSWSRGRAARAAHLTLSLLPPATREALLDEWLDGGGGSSSFFALEAEGFLDFIAGHLSDGSRELTMCRVEQAVHRADRGSATALLRRGSFASLVQVSEASWMLFAPHLPGLVREASARDVALWQALEIPMTLAQLIALGHAPDSVTDFLAVAAAEHIASDADVLAA